MRNYEKIVQDMSISYALRENMDKIVRMKFEEKYKEHVEEALDNATVAMKKSLHNKFYALTESIHSLNVTNTGIIIRGKKDNVAFSKYGSRVLLSCGGDIYRAARLSAYQFSLDFRSVLSIDGVYNTPDKICKFMNTCASFDKISAWYNGDVEFEESQENGTIMATVMKPFVSEPDLYFLTKSYGEVEYIEGYYLSLFNTSSDLLAILSKKKNMNYERKFATSAKKEDSYYQRGKYFYKIEYTNKYAQDWEEIDYAIFFIVELMNHPNIDDSRISDVIETLYNISKLVKNNFDIDVDNIKVKILGDRFWSDLLKDISMMNLDSKTFLYVIQCLLNEVRLEYENGRIKKLEKWKQE